MRNRIEISITPEPLSDQLRHSKLFTMEIQEDLEMLLKIKTFSVDETGLSLVEKANSDNELTENQKNNLKQKYWPIVTEHYTKNHKVNAMGQTDENGIPERDFLQSLTIGQVKAMFSLTDSDSFLDGLYKFVESKINEVVTTGKI